MKFWPGNNEKKTNADIARKNQPINSRIEDELAALREKLKESTQKYQATFEAASIAIASVDKDGKLLEYNRAAAELFGYGAREMLGKNAAGLFTKESVPDYLSGLKRVIEKGYSYNGLYRMIRKDRSVIDVIVSSSAIRDKSGNFQRTVSVIEDITERKFMEDVLKQGEEKYRMIFNAGDDAVFVHQLDEKGRPGKFIAVNKVACERLGYSPEEFRKLGPEDINPASDHAIIRNTIKTIMQKKQVTARAWHVAKNGKRIPVEVNIKFFMLGGKPTIIVNAKDITGITRMEKEAAEQAMIKELRAEIWKIAAEKDIGEDSLIRSLLSRLGEALGCQRTVYSAVKAGKFTGLYEWKRKGVSGSVLGFGVPEEYFRGIAFAPQMLLDKEVFLGLVPEKFRKMTRVFANMLIKAIGENAALVTQCVINREKEGLISCVCDGDSVKTWGAGRRELVIEAANIISSAIEKKRHQDELEVSEMKYRTLFESSLDAVIVHRPLPGHKPGPIIAVNKIACDRFGYTEEEFLKLNLADINAPEARKNPVNATKKIFKEGRVTLETVHITKDGRRIPVEVNAVLINYGGKPTVVSNSRDISERKRLQDKEKRQALINSARTEIWKLAGQKELDDSRLIDGLLAVIGPALSVDRVVFGWKKGNDFIFEFEWKSKDTDKYFKGFKMPNFIYDRYETPSQRVYNYRSFVESAPAGIRLALRPIVNAIRKRYGDNSTLLTPLFVDGVREGVILCAYNSEKMSWDEDTNLLVNEASQILSAVLSRRKTGRKLEESEKLYRELFNNANDGIIVQEMVFKPGSRPVSKVLDFNDEICRIFEMERHEMKDSALADFTDRESLEKMRAEAVKVMAGNTSETVLKMKTKKGRPINVEIRTRMFGLDKSRIMLSVVRDITQRLKSDAALKDSEELFRTVFLTSPDSININRLSDGLFVDVNDGFTTGTGYTREDVKGKTSFQLDMWNKPEDRQKLVDALKKHGYVNNMQLVYKVKDGARKSGLMSARVILIKGEPHLLSIVRDMTDRIKSEEAIRASEEKYRELFNNANDGIFINELDEQGRVRGFLEMNDMACRLTGYNREELAKMTPRDISAPEYLAAYPAIGRALAETGRATYEQEIITRAKKRIHVENNSHKFMLKGRPIVLTIMRDITDRIEAANALVESESKLKGILKVAPVGIGAMSGEKINWSNEKLQEMLGYSYEELFGMHPLRIHLNKAEYDHTLKEIVEQISKSGSGHVETRWKTKKGAILDIYMNFARISPKDPSRGTVFTAMDITDLKKAQEKLKISEEKYKYIISQTGQLVYDYNIITGIIDWAGAIEEITGYTREEFNREVSIDVWGEMIHEEDRKKAFELLETAQEKGAKYTAEYRFRKKNGDFINVLDEGIFLPDDGSGMRRMLGVMKDVSFMKKAEKAIRESEEKFRTISEQTLIAIGIVQDGKLKYFNESFAVVTGYSRREIEAWKPMKYYELIHPEDMPMVMEQSAKKMRNDLTAVIRYPIRFTDKNGTLRWIDNYSNVIDYMGRPAVIFAQSDITQLKNAQFELERTIKELERSNAELERFAYVASHDLQEPLRMVSSYVQLLERRYKDKMDADANDFINYAVEGATRMQKLIKDLLAYSRLGTKEKALVKLDTSVILEKAKENLAGAISERKAVITSSKLPEIIADESQLLQLFQNLLANALKFSKKEGECHVDVTASRKGKEWQFCFRDNGIGIDSQYFEKIFVIFQRLHAASEYSGTGIGLAICKRIVENHGGRIWVESKPGKGAAFYFALPDMEN